MESSLLMSQSEDGPSGRVTSSHASSMLRATPQPPPPPPHTHTHTHAQKNMHACMQACRQEVRFIHASPFIVVNSLVTTCELAMQHQYTNHHHLPKRCRVPKKRFKAASSLPLVTAPRGPMSYISDALVFQEGNPAKEDTPPKICSHEHESGLGMICMPQQHLCM